MFDMLDHDSSKDLSKDRVWDLGTNKLHCRCEDPYGFWYFSFEKGGKLPPNLHGAFTSFHEAQKAVDVYLKDKGKEAKSLQQ